MALAAKERERLRRILDLSDRLGTLRRKVREASATISPKDFTDEVRSIAGSVVSIGLPGTLGRVAEDHHLGPHEVMVLLVLLNRRLEPGDSSLTGREILSTLFPSAYGVLSGISILGSEARLRTSGTLHVAGPETEDLLETSFTISDALFQAVQIDVNPRSREAATEPMPYRSHWEHLADLGRLSTLMLRRSCSLFEMDPYGMRFFEPPEPAPVLDRKVAALATWTKARLEQTRGANGFPLVALARRFRLSMDEQLVLAGLLFQECYYGSPGLDAVECVKMVSRNPEEVLKKRALVAAEGPLRRHGLVEILDPMDEKELNAELVLPVWVSAFMLGEQAGRETPIGPDTRLEFHEYLKGLGDSEQFFSDLDSA